MKKIIGMGIACMIMLAACTKNETGDMNPPSANTNDLAQKSSNGSAGIELVYYDSMLFKMNIYQLSDQAAASELAHNHSINILYEADGYRTVTDAIQKDGYNPVWREVDIVFNSGFAPHQFY